MSNRLANESSPYLLQHADNPVDWYPWCTAALLQARADDKPIFLSIGYSACHWCHVMEHESFEDPQIAQFLNENFVNIKVDREERPDLDHIYMQAVMALQGQGGWPLSAFLTPDQEFFFGGTYWPPRARAHLPGFDSVLRRVLDAYHNRRDDVVAQSKQITRMLQSTVAPSDDTAPVQATTLAKAAEQLRHRWDGTYGGFGGAPKFPQPMELTLLARLSGRKLPRQADTPDSQLMLEMVTRSLTKMSYGGIYDHLGGGFARYSVDARWLVPHFEKMLYDNAQLANVYLIAYRLTGDDLYRQTCEHTLDYLIDQMQDDCGAFHSSEDADSEGVEGKYYVWSLGEILEVLGDDLGQRFCQLYDVTLRGNFEGQNILNLPQSFDQFAQQHQVDPGDLRSQIRHAREKLLAVRRQRIPPGRDDKVIVSWNALAIDSLAHAAVSLHSTRYQTAACRAAEFIWDHMRQPDGRLWHTWRSGQAKLNAYLDDYSYLISAFVSLYRIEFDDKWIERAHQLAELMIAHFSDQDQGGFFYTSDDHETLIARTKEYQDGSVPSGNSMAALGLLRLGRLIGDSEMVELARRTIQSAMPLASHALLAASQTLVAMDYLLHDEHQLVLVLGSDSQASRQVVEEIQSTIDFHSSLIVVDQGQTEGLLAPLLAPMIAGKTAVEGQPTLYICQQFTCQPPLVGRGAIRDAIGSPLGMYAKMASN